jgi:hypothetical protein
LKIAETMQKSDEYSPILVNFIPILMNFFPVLQIFANLLIATNFAVNFTNFSQFG